MASRLAGALGLLAALASGAIYAASGSGQNYFYTLQISGNSSAGFVLTKPTAFFENDFDYTTVWTINSKATENADIQFDEIGLSSGVCPIAFEPAGDFGDCNSGRLTVPAGGTGFINGRAADMYPWQYGVFPFQIKIGPAGGELSDADPDLEIERDYSFASIIAAVVSALSFFLAWLRRRRPTP